MSFVRTKEIPPGSGHFYDYEVMTIHEGGKVIQKHIQYLGRTGTEHPPLKGDIPYTPKTSVMTALSRSPRSPIRQLDSIVKCKYCGSEDLSRFGTYKGVQRYWCNECERKFVNNGSIPKMKNSSRQIASAMSMYYNGMPLDGIQTQFRQDYQTDLSESNFWNWVDRFTKDAIRQSKTFKPDVGDEWVADEMYMKLGKRKVYFWDIVDSKTRFLLATHVSFTRGTKDAEQLMKEAGGKGGQISQGGCNR